LSGLTVGSYMLTFEQIGDEAAAQAKDTSTATRTVIDRAINQGMQKFGAILNREWRNDELTFSTVADQQYYQMPETGIRIKTIVITIGGVSYPLTEISSEDAWNELNRTVETSDTPEFYHCKGADQFGIWPIPASSTASAGRIMLEPRMRRMSQDDYTTGTIAVTTDSAAVVGSGTTFTAQMVGRYLIVEDAGDQDGVGYKVITFTDATHLVIENNYAGLTGSGKSYRIGEVPDIPEEFHEALVDYALYRVYKRRKDRGNSKDAKDAFDEAVALCEATYSSMSASQYTRARPIRRPLYRHADRDYMVT
jgi:hypothetical protein